MKIAIIGGGAAGMATAWYLGDAHQVTVFEREAMLGGNIRTLRGNVSCEALPEGVTLDAGVIEFSRTSFPLFHALMDELDVELLDVPGTTALYVDGRPPLQSPSTMAEAGLGWAKRLAGRLRLAPVARAHRRFFARTRDVPMAELYGRALDAYLADSPFAEWSRLLMLYAYSMPPRRLERLPAALTVPTLRAFLQPNEWTAIRGGSYTWIERVLDRRVLEVCTSARIRSVWRSPSGVEIDLESGESSRFDKVVVATTPDQVLHLLADATGDERRRFGVWTGHEAWTLVHSDTGLYARRRIRYFSEFDLFHTAAGLRGYNAYLNRLCAIPESAGVHYNLAYGIDGEIDPAKVLHRQRHHTPSYTVEALKTREEIKAANGQNHTVFAGAWLYDGLHEGALNSGREAARLLG